MADPNHGQHQQLFQDFLRTGVLQGGVGEAGGGSATLSSVSPALEQSCPRAGLGSGTVPVPSRAPLGARLCFALIDFVIAPLIEQLQQHCQGKVSGLGREVGGCGGGRGIAAGERAKWVFPCFSR